MNLLVKHLFEKVSFDQRKDEFNEQTNGYNGYLLLNRIVILLQKCS